MWLCVCVCVFVRARWHPRPRFLWPPSFVAFQRHNGEILTAASVKHLSHWRFVVSFQLDRVQRTDQDLYRCVTQSPRGSGVSNFAELVVKGNRRLFSLHFIAPPLPFLRPPRSPNHPAFFPRWFLSRLDFPASLQPLCRIKWRLRMKLIAACSNRLQWETQMMSAPAKNVCARCRNSQTCFLFQIDFHETQIVWCLTHINGFWTANVGTRACCFFSPSKLRLSNGLSYSAFQLCQKAAHLTWTLAAPCHIMYHRWWPPSPLLSPAAQPDTTLTAV